MLKLPLTRTKTSNGRTLHAYRTAPRVAITGRTARVACQPRSTRGRLDRFGASVRAYEHGRHRVARREHAGLSRRRRLLLDLPQLGARVARGRLPRRLVGGRRTRCCRGRGALACRDPAEQARAVRTCELA